LGISPNAQSLYGIHELGIYDPMMPSAYFSSWQNLVHHSAGFPNDSLYCPAITTIEQARLYGVGFVLEPAHSPGPAGSEFVRTIGDESLFRVPDSGSAVLVITHNGDVPPGPFAPGTVETVGHSDPAHWSIRTESQSPGSLRLRLVDVPGWHAEIDGHPVDIQKFDGLMMSVRVPAGSHEVQLSYWPSRFTEGIALAVLAVAIMIVALIAGVYRKHRRSLVATTDVETT